MSTTALPISGPIGEHHRSFWRFAWKEYRMLRGFWLAVAALAVLVQLISLATLPDSTETAQMLFGIALGATVLYAVGAAATLFAVEHEEETYDLLMTLPVQWQPVFWAKLVVAVASSIALGTVLVGGSLAMGGVWSRDTAYLLLPAVAESIAWGIFMSLTIRRPLVAAVATIAAVSVVVNVLMSFLSEFSTPITDPTNYPASLPWRMAIVAVVLMMDVALGREWLQTSAAPRLNFWKRLGRPTVAATTVVASQTSSVSTWKMMSRLLWQTWRESWKWMLLTILFAGTFGMFGVAMALTPVLNKLDDILQVNAALFAALVMLSALYGSQVFMADQRGRHYRFLGEHAARSRLVWLCRHAVWLGGLLGLLILAVACSGPWLVAEYGDAVRQMESRMARDPDNWMIAFDLFEWMQVSNATIAAAASSLMGILSGYAVGQFASLFVRRSLSAGLLAMILASFMVAWGFVLHLWQLPLLYFLMPVVIGLFAATWLRISDWLVDRNSIWGWAKPLLAVAIPSLAVLACLPGARLSQVGALGVQSSEDATKRPATFDTPFGNQAEELFRLAESIEGVDAEVGDELSQELRFRNWEREYAQKNSKLIRRAMELSTEPIVQLPVYYDDSAELDRLLNLASLIQFAGDANLADGQLSEALSKYLAALRVLGTIRRGQTSRTIGMVLSNEANVWNQILKWARYPEQTSEMVKTAIAELNQIYPETAEARAAIRSTNAFQPPDIRETADLAVLSDVVQGWRQPKILNSEYTRFSDHLAVLANNLPFERRRAQAVLAHIASAESDAESRVVSLLQAQQSADDSPNRQSTAAALRELIAGADLFSDYFGRELNSLSPHAATSFLPIKERRARADFPKYLETIANTYVRQLALKLQLALLAYRLDHDRYPTKFDELVPNYLSRVPIDPFSGEPFKYEPTGLAKTLALRGGDDDIEPDTPFFWSVGVDNNQLTLDRVEILAESLNPNVAGYSTDETERQYYQVYRLMPRQMYWASTAPLVFPLPPVFPMSATPAPPADEAE